MLQYRKTIAIIYTQLVLTAGYFLYNRSKPLKNETTQYVHDPTSMYTVAVDTVAKGTVAMDTVAKDNVTMRQQLQTH